MIIPWPEFKLDLTSLKEFLDTNVPESDGISATPDNMEIVEKIPFSSETIELILNHINSLNEQDEHQKLLIKSQITSIQNTIKSAIEFGANLQIEMITNNIKMGITQAGLTQPVADYLFKVSYYLSTGSLYAAIHEIDNLILDNSPIKQSLSPFVTNEILILYRNKIASYVGI